MGERNIKCLPYRAFRLPYSKRACYVTNLSMLTLTATQTGQQIVDYGNVLASM